MSRFLLLALLNFALPFLLRAGWIILLKFIHKQRKNQRPEIIDVTPRWHFPIMKLLAIGLLCLAISLIGWRLLSTEGDVWHPASPAISHPAEAQR